MEESSYPTLELSRRIGVQWPNIEASRTFSRQTLALLRGALAESDSDDTSVVVFGSLGREEFTPGSDIDWNLLVDGIADPNHHALFLDAQKKIKEVAAKSVGREESAPIGRSVARERVLKSILKRYLLEDLSFWRGTTVHRHHIPHFLLNDIARFWRTMAVDFAYKLRTRSGEGWAMRNIKLRMSRKLVYVSGLIACFRCHLVFPPEGRHSVFSDQELRLEVVDVVDAIFSAKPLDIVAILGMEYEHLYGALSQVFGAYDEFLGILMDESLRRRLETLEESAGDRDPLYQQARTMSHRFRDAIFKVLFDEKSELGLLTRLCGVV